MKKSILRVIVVFAAAGSLLVPALALAKPVSFTALGQLTSISTKPAQLTVLIHSIKPSVLQTLRSAEVNVGLTARTTYMNAKKKRVRIKDIPTYSQVSVEGQYDGKKFLGSKVTLIKADEGVPKGEKIMDRIEGAVQTALFKAKAPKKKGIK